ncbi:MAG: hypothetical protein WB869_11710 [Candidatus Acidiferrales bacterium]
MIAALICVISFCALLQFGFSSSRSVVAASRELALSDQVRRAAGIQGAQIDGGEFARLLQLAKLCPVQGTDGLQIAMVRAYHGVLHCLEITARGVLPHAGEWIEQERQNCAYFVAVALDRRIANSRGLLAAQMAAI